MSLSFTTIPDRTGPAVYIIGNGLSQLDKQLHELGNQIVSLVNNDTQVVILDSSRGDGMKFKESYSLQFIPCLLVVLDDDTIARSWEVNLPRAEEVSYVLSHINGSMR